MSDDDGSLEFFNLGYEAGCVNADQSTIGVDSTPRDRMFWLIGWTSGREQARFMKEREAMVEGGDGAVR